MATDRITSWRRQGALLVLLTVVIAPGAQAVDGYRTRWEKDVAARGVDPQEAVFVFAVTPAMAEWAAQRVAGIPEKHVLAQLEALQRALFDDDRFEYEAASTLTAPEAFALRRGNCMAFTSLFIALARSLGLTTVLVSVDSESGIVREDGLVVVNRHVVAGYRDLNQLHLFDFYATSDAPYLRQRVIGDLTASAMYHTNIGGAALRNGDPTGARRNLELATRLAPDWAPAWINLGVALRREGRYHDALDACRNALAVEPSNPSALTNMAAIYRSLGDRRAEHNALEAAADGTRNPFTLIALADLAMNRGELVKAHAYLRRARSQYPREAEVFDGLARLAGYRGEVARLERYRKKAAELRALTCE